MARCVYDLLLASFVVDVRSRRVLLELLLRIFGVLGADLPDIYDVRCAHGVGISGPSSPLSSRGSRDVIGLRVR